EQVVSNFVANALAHTKPGDEIIVSGRYFPKAHAYTIAVRDTGVGIRQEDRKHVFERFYRVEGSRLTGSEGIGLGLSIGREIVEAHHGRIGVRSRVGRGSTFYF